MLHLSLTAFEFPLLLLTVKINQYTKWIMYKRATNSFKLIIINES